MVASRTRGALRKPKREPEDHPNLLWRGTTRQQKRDLNFILNKMYFRSIDVPKVLNWKTMETLGRDKIMADVLMVRKVIGSEFVTVIRGNRTRLYLSRDLEKLTTPTRQCT